MDPIEDAQAELHEMERQAERVAGTLERAGPDEVRVLTEVRDAIRLARYRLAVGRRIGAELAAA